MNEIYLNGNCPNCGNSFKPDMSFGNLHRCEACKQWSVFINGRINENVIYKIIPFLKNKEKLRQALAHEIGEKYDKKSFKKLGEVQVESFYLPVREIKSGPERELISANMEYNSLHVGLLSDKKNSETIKCADYDKLLPIDLQKDFSESMIKDSSLVTLEVDIEKNKQDKAYDLPKFGFYKIIYLPLYKISFTKNDDKWYCLGLKDFPGLKESIKSYKHTSTYLIHPWLVATIVILGGLRGCANTTTPLEGLWHTFLGMLVGFLICLGIAAWRGHLMVKKESNWEKTIMKQINI